MKPATTKLIALLAALSTAGLLGCVGADDIDRTQPNRLPKSLFSGTWYVRSTIIGVPGTAAASFIGYTGKLEKVRWEIQEEWLIAYRAYQEIPGTDSQSKSKAGSGGTYKENPVAAYRILSHFDIKRQYVAATGEQTNVIEENTSDRPWHQREFIRVDWSQSRVDPMSFSSVTGDSKFNASYFVQQSADSPDAMRIVNKAGDKLDFDKLAVALDRSKWDAGKVTYFDMVGRFLLEPEKVNYTYADGSTQKIPLCYFIRYAGQSFQTSTCGAAEVKIRTSFMKATTRNYEPVALPDREMGKFGYFRTERFTWDRKYGFTESGRVYLANLHNIWKKAYKTDADGKLEVGADGKYVKIPLAQRTPKPIVYHLNKDYPCDLVASAQQVAASWNTAFRRSVAVAKGLLTKSQGDIDAEVRAVPRDKVPDMFVLDLNGWVQKQAGADYSCANLTRDETKVTALVGDLRFSFMHWVHDRQISGPLGYGPSSADPETGEIIAGQAFVYGAAVDTYAGRALDIVRMLNGDLTVGDVISADYIKKYIAQQKPVIDPAKIPAAARAVRGAKIRDLLLSKKVQAKIAAIRKSGFERTVVGARARRQQRLAGTPLADKLLDQELVKGLAPYLLKGKAIGAGDSLSKDVLRLLSPLSWASPATRAIEKLRIDKAARQTIWLAEFADDSVQGLAVDIWKKYGKSKNYDAMHAELKRLIYRAVMEHEVGHTIGLRHNFSGSYDSVNFHNHYWKLRAENLQVRDPLDTTQALTFADLYKQANQTKAQIAGRMREYQYSTIMDYGNQFNSDVHGIGKYDHAAVLFGYTGHVEVFDRASKGAKVALRQRFSDCSSRYESVPNLAYSPILEQWHYSSIWNLLGKTAGLTTRRFAKWTDVKRAQSEATSACKAYVKSGQGTALQFNQKQDGDRPLEVPYMFCSDEYVGATVSCQRWDSGADPYEIVDNVIKTYKQYYFFNNYKRDRFGFNSYSVYSRVLSRYFSYLPNVYQHWLFRVASYGLDDVTLENYWTVGTFNGFNLLVDTIKAPQYGTYCKGDASGQCKAGGDRWVRVSGSTDAPDDKSHIVIGRGVGRRRYSRYDYDSGYYYQNQIGEVGHFWEYLAALQTLSASTGTFVGVETGTDFTTYLVPYFIVFEDELTKLFEGVITDNYAAYAPRISGGKISMAPTATIGLSNGTRIDPATGAALTTASTGGSGSAAGSATQSLPVDLDNWFTLKFYTLVEGMSEFRSLYSLRFADRQQIFRVGSGDEVKPADGKTVLSCQDPIGGHIYGTIQDSTPTPGSDAGSAIRLIKKCQDEVKAYSSAKANAPDSQAFFRARSAMNNTIEWLNFMRGLYGLYGTNL